MTTAARTSAWVFAAPFCVLFAAACDKPVETPAFAGKVTVSNQDTVVPRGETAGGRPGDYYLRNAHGIFIVQRAARDLAIGPYGGSLIDIAGTDGYDQFGELIPSIGIGRTVQVDELVLESDGRDGATAVLVAHGHDATNAYINLEAIDPELISYKPEGGGLLSLDPDAPLGLEVDIRYSMARDEAVLEVEYTFRNASDARLDLPLAVMVDTQATVENFVPGAGFQSGLAKSFNAAELLALLGLEEPTEQLVIEGKHGAISIVPRRVGDSTAPRSIAFTVPAVGAAIVFGAQTAIGAAYEPTFTLMPGASAEIALDVLVAPTGALALEAGWRRLGWELGEIEGCVTVPGGAPAQARVGLTDTTRGPVGFFDTDADGCFSGFVPPGDYVAVAGVAYRPYSSEVAVTVPGRVDLELAPTGQLRLEIDIFNELDDTEPSLHPCRLTLVGDPTDTEHPALGTVPIDRAPPPIHRLFYLRTCRETVEVTPGRYLAFITRGPEFTRVQRVIEVVPDAIVAINDTLGRAVNSDGYAASDFHVHSIYSSDSVVPAEARALSLATEGMDFWVSLEHDNVADYQKQVDALGLRNELLTAPGDEVTTFELGHFGAFPLDVVATQASGGTPDWGVSAEGVRPTMEDLFGMIHERGALVQVNHPRGGGMAFQNYFSRAGVRYDASTKAMLADPALQLLPNSLLRFPEGLVYFSDNFDLIEVMNGASTYVDNGMVYERDLEGTGEDWMNLLSAGRRVPGVANSDTHGLADPPGDPRTMVGGHDDGVAGILEALMNGDAVMSTGPVLRAQLEDPEGDIVSFGGVLTPSGNSVTLHVRAETPDWYQVNRVEVIANYFTPTVPSGSRPVPLLGPSALTLTEQTYPNGAKGWVAEADFEIDLTQPTFANDSWLVVRVGGADEPLFPVTFGGGGTLDTSAETPEEFLTEREGTLPIAIGNPIYLDTDGNGVWAP